MQDGSGSGKEIINIPVDSALIDQARDRGVNLAELMDRALRREFPDRKAQSSAAAE